MLRRMGYGDHQMLLEVKADGHNIRVPRVTFGLAAPYDCIAELHPGELFTFFPGAFSRIRTSVTLHFNHDTSLTLASTESGRLTVFDVPGVGLHFETELDSLAQFVERRGIQGASIGFRVDLCDRSTCVDSRGRLVHTVRDCGVALNEISVLTGVAPKFRATWAMTTFQQGGWARYQALQRTPGYARRVPRITR